MSDNRLSWLNRSPSVANNVSNCEFFGSAPAEEIGKPIIALFFPLIYFITARTGLAHAIRRLGTVIEKTIKGFSRFFFLSFFLSFLSSNVLSPAFKLLNELSLTAIIPSRW